MKQLQQIKQIFYNSGHHINDSGAVYHGRNENELAMALGKEIIPLIKDFGTLRLVSDTLNLKQTIEFINQSAQPNDFAFSTHFNTHRNHRVRGVEVYYSDLVEKKYAEVFARHISKALGIPNRGARSDRWTYVGYLGFLRKLKCPSILVEVCYLTNEADMATYTPQRAAQGFQNAFKELFTKQVRKNTLTEKQINALLDFIWNFSKDSVVVERVRKTLTKQNYE